MIASGAGESRFDTWISTWNLPCDGKAAGGDWCRTVQLTDDVIALTIGDVCGHDAGAAELMATRF